MPSPEQLHRIIDDYSASPRPVSADDERIYVCPRCRSRSDGPGFCYCREGGTAFRRATARDLQDPEVRARAEGNAHVAEPFRSICNAFAPKVLP